MVLFGILLVEQSTDTTPIIFLKVLNKGRLREGECLTSNNGITPTIIT